MILYIFFIFLSYFNLVSNNSTNITHFSTKLNAQINYFYEYMKEIEWKKLLSFQFILSFIFLLPQRIWFCY